MDNVLNATGWVLDRVAGVAVGAVIGATVGAVEGLAATEGGDDETVEAGFVVGALIGAIGGGMKGLVNGASGLLSDEE